MRICVCLILLIVSLTHASTSQQQARSQELKSELEKAWKLDFEGLSLDPTAWSSTLAGKLSKVAVGVGYAMTLPMSLAHVVGFGLFLFGLVRLTWGIVGTSCLALYGWKYHKRSFLVAGVGLTYALAFGLSTLY
ncbi:hypothetical protein [Wuhan flea virus]|uniref:hypothetical protein n=1 Tax=Wuhan flea virus TaxID=1746071 RepID=UPI000706267E|nr:hypothetical protein [Wuhan flea virus]ALL52911.1 hypothetical protein [Wuhan flea virus]